MSEEELSYPIVLDAEPIMLSLKPESEDVKSERPIKKITGWEISQADKELIQLGKDFCKKLRSKLKNTNNRGKAEFLELFTSHLVKIGEKVGISVELHQLGEEYACKLVEKLGPLMGRDVKSLILEACLVFEVWGVLESLVTNGVVEHSCISNLVHNLIEKRKSNLIELCVKHLSDIQTYELMCILKYFLLLPDDGYESLVSVRKDWESQALLAIVKASGEGVSGKYKNLAKDSALLVMVAHDGFSVTELCLHSLLSSRNLDEVIFSACIGKLKGEELKALIHYLGKWLRKYESFPQVVPCPKASSALGLKVCDWIPTLENVIKCLSWVVDEHFSSLALQSEFHEELRSLEGILNSLASEAKLCGTLGIITERL
ncbi:hypothetical protein F511_02238 [Dorcoceras hygrometricum]|uniref:Uncharacterized protein n=1 Tax=Dorcoceras hygrometricum TaxID=472368 RepID=A0A2Z7AVH1_9LAMI|nr:hypothetical protein F511_02238 [Dorcoceras hygrometricum]